MRYLLWLSIVLLAGCGSIRGEMLIWDGHPRVVLCESQDQMAEHADGFQFSDGSGGFHTLHGLYVRAEDTVYLLCSDTDGRLSIRQAFYLAHELQHRADERNNGSMWDVLQDLSSPNGYLMGGDDFDCHHHKRISPDGGR